MTDVDLAEHTPGTPFHFKHGWIRTDGLPEPKIKKPKVAKVAKAKVAKTKVAKVKKPKLTEDLVAKAEAAEKQLAAAKKWNADHPLSADNVLKSWDDATPQEIASGMTWYADAQRSAKAFAEKNGISTAQAAAIIGVYSPQTSWANNLLRAAGVIEGGKGVGGKGSPFMAMNYQRIAADRILAGEDWNKILLGQKVSRFARMVEHGGDKNPDVQQAVVDRHALSVAAGATAGEAEYQAAGLGGIKKYAAAEKTFVDAAKIISAREGRKVTAQQVQAATWLAQQRKNEAIERAASPSKASRRAGVAAHSWKAWRKYAETHYPELIGTEALTGSGMVNLATPQPSTPYYGAAQDPYAPVTMTTPPTSNKTVQHIVEILLAAWAINETAEAIAAIVPGISVAIWKRALGATGNFGAHARLNAHGIKPDSPGGKVATSAARREIYFRAAYVARSAERIQSDVNGGMPIDEAVKKEIPTYKSHEAARRGRLDAAAKVGAAANNFGPLLGWYLNPLLNNEVECITANGHNFYASDSTLIGDPGAVHLNCGCKAGPPIEGAGMVNDAIDAARAVIFVQPRRFGLKKAG